MPRNTRKEIVKSPRIDEDDLQEKRDRDYAKLEDKLHKMWEQQDQRRRAQRSKQGRRRRRTRRGQGEKGV